MVSYKKAWQARNCTALVDQGKDLFSSCLTWEYPSSFQQLSFFLLLRPVGECQPTVRTRVKLHWGVMAPYTKSANWARVPLPNLGRGRYLSNNPFPLKQWTDYACVFECVQTEQVRGWELCQFQYLSIIGRYEYNFLDNIKELFDCGTQTGERTLLWKHIHAIWGVGLDRCFICTKCTIQKI